MRIKELSTTLRPYEKCEQRGPEALSDEELLSVIIRCGTKDEDSVSLSKRVLSVGNPDDGILNILNVSVNELKKIKGIGRVKAIQIKCIGELSKRISQRSYSTGNTFTSAEAVADFFMENMRHLKREKLMALMLDSACKLLRVYEVSTGTVNTSLASSREVFIEALRSEAVNIILVHNHPSGNPAPSREDLRITGVLHDAGELIGINIIDHIIIGDNKFVSFKEQGIIG